MVANERSGGLTLDDAQSLVDLFFPLFPPRPLDSNKEIAGLSTGSRPQPTWERVYTLALVGLRRSHVERRGADPKVLAEIAARPGIADFSRSRHDFFASRPGAGGAFRDPSGDFLELCAGSRSSTTGASTRCYWRIFFKEALPCSYSTESEALRALVAASARLDPLRYPRGQRFPIRTVPRSSAVG